MRPTSDWWDEQCPSRGVALSHIPAGRIKGKCRFCAKFEPSETSAVTTVPGPVTAPRPLADHVFLWTITGRCRHTHCARTEDEHIMLSKDPSDQCTVDHDSIRTGRLISDDGWQWSSCPVCGTQIEPALAKHTVARLGHGVMPFTQRHWKEIINLKAAFENGVYKS